MSQPGPGQPRHRQRLLRRLLAADGQADRLGRARGTSRRSTSRSDPLWLDTGRALRPAPGDPAPADGALPDAALAELGHAALRVLRARAVLRGALRLLRLQHLHRRRARRPAPGRLAGDVRRGGDRRDPPGPAGCSATRTSRCDTVFFGGGTPTLLTPADLGAVLAAIAAEFGLAAGRRGDDRGQPGQRRPLGPRGAARGRLQPDLASACSRPSPHVLATLDRTHDPRRVPAVVGWARDGRLRPGQPRPHLRHAGGVARGLADLARRRPGLRARPRLGVLADRRGGHRPGPAGPARRAAGARRRRPGRQVPAGRRAARRPPGWSWYEVSNWARDRRSRLPAQPRSTGPAATGGASGPGAHSHVGGVRWWNVKHPAAYAERLAAGVSPAQAREVLDDETRRTERVLLEIRLRDGLPLDVLDAAGRAAVPGPGRAGLLDRGRRTGWCSRPRAGCSPTPWSATCCRDRLRAVRQETMRMRQRVAVVLAVGGLDRADDREDQPHAARPRCSRTIPTEHEIRIGRARSRRSAARAGSSATPTAWRRTNGDSLPWVSSTTSGPRNDSPPIEAADQRAPVRGASPGALLVGAGMATGWARRSRAAPACWAAYAGPARGGACCGPAASDGRWRRRGAGAGRLRRWPVPPSQEPASAGSLAASRSGSRECSSAARSRRACGLRSARGPFRRR